MKYSIAAIHLEWGTHANHNENIEARNIMTTVQALVIQNLTTNKNNLSHCIQFI